MLRGTTQLYVPQGTHTLLPANEGKPVAAYFLVQRRCSPGNFPHLSLCALAAMGRFSVPEKRRVLYRITAFNAFILPRQGGFCKGKFCAII